MSNIDIVNFPPAQDSVRRAPLRARTSWVMFDWAAQPFYTLVLTFLFSPYFANVVAPTSQQGQAYWGYAAGIAGLIIAVGSPLLGAMADGGARRKPWIALFSLVFIGAMAALWIAMPQASTATVLGVLAAFVVAMVAVEFASVFTNSMMPGLVPRSELGRLSGTSYAAGYAGGLISLALVAGLLIPVPETGKTILGLTPLLALDAATREGERLIGPLSALWFFVFVIPFFLFVPDRKPVTAGARAPLAELWSTIRSLPSHRDMLLFLIARMIYADGLAAIFTFGGIYGTSVFGWNQAELGIFGIIIVSTGVIGALVGGVLDDRLGSKTVIVGALLLLAVALAGILSIDKTHAFFVVDIPPKEPGAGPLSALGERIYLAFAMLVGLVAAPVQAASRTLLARLAPPEKITQYFGLFAFSGKATAYLAPLMIAAVISLTDDQRLGMSVIAAFLLVGVLLMLPVRQPR